MLIRILNIYFQQFQYFRNLELIELFLETVIIYKYGIY